MVINEVKPSEIAELSLLARRTYTDTFGSEFEPGDLDRYLEATVSVTRWRQYLVHDQVMMAWNGAAAVGFIHFGRGEDKAEVVIHRLYVDKGAQGQGIGTCLLERALAHDDVKVAALVRIDVWENNHDARRLYERYGFRHEGRMEPFISDDGLIEGYDLVLIKRRNSPSD